MSFTRQVFRYNNTELIYTHSIYVSPNGNDTTGNGTKDKPYKTIQYATSKVINDTTAIILLPGIYNENPYVNTTAVAGSAYTLSTNGNVHRYASVSMNKGLFMSTTYQTNFFGYPNQTFVNVTFNQLNSSVVMAGRNKPLNMYGITVNVNCLASGNDSNCFIASLPDSYGGNIYNCVFKYITSFGFKRGIIHSVYNGSAYNAYNCIFDMGDVTNATAGERHCTFYESDYVAYYGWGSYYSVTDYNDPNQNSPLNSINCMFLNIQNFYSNNSTTTGPIINCTNCVIPNSSNYCSTALTNCIKNDTRVDADYYPLQITSWQNAGLSTIKNPDNTVSNIGVYGGLYKWNKTFSQNANIIIDNFNDKVNKNSSEQYGFTIQPPTTKGLIKSEQTFSGNFIGSDNIKYSYPLNPKEWSTLKRVEFL